MASASPKGVIEARLTRGGHVNEYRYAREGDIVRIEQLWEKPPIPPINLLDLETGALTIFYPHNSTFMTLPAERLDTKPAAGPRMPGPDAPPNRQGADNGPKGLPEIPTLPKTPRGIGPQSKSDPAESSTDAGNPDMPEMPSGIGPRADGNAPGSGPARPRMPAGMAGGGMPMMPPTMPVRREESAPPELEKTEETREIHGVECVKYRATVPREGVFEVWATDELFPFRLLTQRPPLPRGRPDFHETWPALLRDKGLFPMLAVLKDKDGKEGRERFRFEATAWHPEKVPQEAGTFTVPEGYYEMEPMPF